MRTCILYVKITDDDWCFETAAFGDKSHDKDRNYIKFGTSMESSELDRLKASLSAAITQKMGQRGSSLDLREVINDSIAELMRRPVSARTQVDRLLITPQG